ncbi:MAG TPA: RNA polymerase sigma factor [bacterium]|nr:RNA polymerase sigma factor [bacterium]HPN35515.1 RNA polymerase sigma factor [bacterium]
MMDENEIQLIKRAQQGDRAAFSRLVLLHDRRILQTAHAILNDLPDSEDVYQETFMRAFRHLASFRFECQFSTWLTRIAVNLARNRLRSRRVRPTVRFEEQTSLAHPAEQDFELHRRLLQEAIDQLSVRLRTVVTLKYFQGYKIREIAEIMHCGDGAIKKDLFRALEKLRTIFSQEIRE